MLRILDLFSGVGGFSLGLERTGGFETVGFVEKEPACHRVLRKHWDAPIHDDVCTRAYREGEADVIAGGFPCQDISQAGKRAGLAGARSGLWGEMVRAVRVVRPLYLVVENVAALLRRGMGRVLGDLAESGYDAEWDCIPASAVGAPHIRDRVWIIAQPQHPDSDRQRPHQAPLHLVGGAELRHEQVGVARQVVPALAGALSGLGSTSGGGWHPEPGVRRVVDGLPAEVDRVKQLGNAVVPRIPEMIGRAILASRLASPPSL